MSDKYIIRNCPAILRMTKVCDDYRTTRDNPQLCKECTDCVMKQIVELAKGHTELCKNCDQQIKECDCNDICNAYRLNKILQLLDIQEVE